MRKLFFLLLIFTSEISCQKSATHSNQNEEAVAHADTSNAASSFSITPIEHATAVFSLGEQIFYIDPVGGVDAFSGQPEPDFILLTDIHGDHFDEETVNGLRTPATTVIAPPAVIDLMKSSIKDSTLSMTNGQKININHIEIEAIAMYNLREEALQFHVKGRGNGYVIQAGEERIYFSGDTEDIPEMRDLKNIDKAFVCMNLPYTMTVEQAASAVLEFQPRQVFPYHYRGKDGLSDVQLFKNLVEEKSDQIEVVWLDWYPAED